MVTQISAPWYRGGVEPLVAGFIVTNFLQEL
jgi:hypothetical protein